MQWISVTLYHCRSWEEKQFQSERYFGDVPIALVGLKGNFKHTKDEFLLACYDVASKGVLQVKTYFDPTLCPTVVAAKSGAAESRVCLIAFWHYAY